MGQYERAIVLQEVITIRPATPRDCSVALADRNLFAEE
jgi:hypothetical protein